MADDIEVNNGPLAAVREKWGWLLALGIVLAVAGVIAFGNLFAATVVSVLYIGVLIFIGGIGYLVHAFQVKGWQHRLYWGLSGVLYALAGLLAFWNPALTAAALTFLLAIALLVAGGFRIWVGFRLRPQTGSGWIIAGGIVTVLTGLLVAASWPVNSLFVLGLFLAVDLIAQGTALIVLALALRRPANEAPATTAGPEKTETPPPAA